MVLNFYAPWCPWCQRLEPTWEAVTQEIHKRYPESDGRIRFGKVLSMPNNKGLLAHRAGARSRDCIVGTADETFHWHGT